MSCLVPINHSMIVGCTNYYIRVMWKIQNGFDVLYQVNVPPKKDCVCMLTDCLSAGRGSRLFSVQGKKCYVNIPMPLPARILYCINALSYLVLNVSW